jgi:arginine utilization protein RocB
MSTQTAQTTNTANLAQTVTNMPSHKNEELEVTQRLKKEAELAISRYLAATQGSYSPFFCLHVLLRRPHRTEEGVMEYDESEIECLQRFLEDIRKLMMDPRFARALVKQGNMPVHSADYIDRLVKFFADLNQYEARAHLKLYHLQRWEDSDYSSDKLKGIAEIYEGRAKIEETTNDLFRTPKRK